MVKLYFKNYQYRIVILPLVVCLMASLILASLLFRKEIVFVTNQYQVYDDSPITNGYVLNYSSGLNNEYAFPGVSLALYKDEESSERLPLSCYMELSGSCYDLNTPFDVESSARLKQGEIKISLETAENYGIKIGDIVFAEYSNASNTEPLTVVGFLNINYDIISPTNANNIGVALLGCDKDFLEDVKTNYVLFSGTSLADQLSDKPQIINSTFSFLQLKSSVLKQILPFIETVIFCLFLGGIAQILFITKKSAINIAVLKRKGLKASNATGLMAVEIAIVYFIPALISTTLPFFWYSISSQSMLALLEVLLIVTLLFSVLYYRIFIYLSNRR